MIVIGQVVAGMAFTGSNRGVRSAASSAIAGAHARSWSPICMLRFHQQARFGFLDFRRLPEYFTSPPVATRTAGFSRPSFAFATPIPVSQIRPKICQACLPAHSLCHFEF